MATHPGPFAAPAGWREDHRLRLSQSLTHGRVVLAILVIVQCLTGWATAAVISQEGTRAHGFVAGMAMFTMILAALVGFAGSLNVRRPVWRFLWAAFVTFIAWMVYVVSLAFCAHTMFGNVGITRADLPRIAFMALVTVAFVLLLQRRTTGYGRSRTESAKEIREIPSTLSPDHGHTFHL